MRDIPGPPGEQGAVGGTQVVPLLMCPQDTGQGAQLCLTRPGGQLVFVHPSSGQASGVRQERLSFLL